MRRIFRILGLSMVIVAILAVVIAGSVSADSYGPMGPAPNAGDGIPDGSGFDTPNGPNGNIGAGSGPIGPAPNAGDGIPDGSGF